MKSKLELMMDNDNVRDTIHIHFVTLIGLMLDPPTNNRQFADKCGKVGMDGVP